MKKSVFFQYESLMNYMADVHISCYIKTMKNLKLCNALNILDEEFKNLNWNPYEQSHEKIYRWPGNIKDEIRICVHKGNGIQEPFHHQDFFFLNYAYKNNYDALSYKYDNHITIQEGECYIGQPFSGYALNGHYDQEIIIIGVLIQKETFFKTFLPVLSKNTKLFHFFLDSQINQFSDEYIHLKFEDITPIQSLLDMMVLEYASKKEDTQDILKPLVLALFMHVARQYNISYPKKKPEKLSDEIISYISEHYDSVTLQDLSQHFSYHPNYISTLLPKETGQSFSQIVLEQRMERAISLIQATTLSIEDISYMLGYSNPSNFYKAFKNYYGHSPRKS